MSISYYVIHLVTKSPERVENIKENEKILGQKMEIFPAINGSEVSYQQFDYRITKKYNANPGEIGCYLSHMNIMKNIREKEGYTVVFEDDLEIMVPDLDYQIRNIIEDLGDNFDIVYLGSLTSVSCLGEHYKKYLHRISKNSPLYGTHAYIVNNKSAQKIYDNLLLFNDAIDNRYKQLYDQNILNNYIVFPYFVSQKSKTTMKSVIHY